MDSNCLYDLFRLYCLKNQGSVSVSNQDQYYSMIMMIHLLLRSPFDDNLTLSLLYLLDIFWDYDQSSEGEKWFFKGQEIFRGTYFAESCIPTFKLDKHKPDALVLGGPGITEFNQPVMPATYTGITEASVLLFDLMEEKKSLRAVFYYLIKWMIDKGLSKEILTDILLNSILDQNEGKEVTMSMNELDDNPTTIGPKKLNRLICIELLSIIIMPILAVIRYGMTTKPVTDFPLFLFYNDTEGKMDYPFTNISDINEFPKIEPVMVPSLILSNDSTDLFLKYKQRFIFNPYSYHYPKFKGCHELTNVSNKMFGYLLFDLIEKVVEILDEREIETNRSVIINIIAYLMEFPRILYEYASLYGWRQDPHSYETIYKDIITKYCETVVKTGQRLLDFCFITAFSKGQIDEVDEVDITSFGNTDDEMALFMSVQEIGSKLLEEDEEYFMNFFSTFVDWTVQHNRIDFGILATLGMHDLSPTDLLCKTLSLAIANRCDVGSVRSPIDIFSEPCHFMHSDVTSLFLTGLEYVVFLLRAVSNYAPSVGAEDFEIYREIYGSIGRNEILEIVFNAFGIQVTAISFMDTLRKMLDDIILAKDRPKSKHILLMVPRFLLSAITEIDAMYYHCTENHIPLTGEFLQQYTQNLQFNNAGLSAGVSKTSSLAFTSRPAENCVIENLSRKDGIKDGKGTTKKKADSNTVKMALEIINEKSNFLHKMFEKFLDKDPSIVDRLWLNHEYAKQIALFQSKYDILYRTLCDIYFYSSQVYIGMASVMDTYRLPSWALLETRASLIKRGYIGGVYRNSLEWYVIQAIRDHVMIPELRSSLKRVYKITCVSTGILTLHLNDVEETSSTAPSLQDLANCCGICSPNRYGMALFFSNEENGSLMLVTAHSVFYLTDSTMIALTTAEDFSFISSNISKLTVFVSPIQKEILMRKSLFGNFIYDAGSSEMVCNGMSYCKLNECKYCRTKGAILHGRYKEKNYLGYVIQFITPLIDFHTLFLKHITSDRENKDAHTFQFRNLVLDKLCSADTSIISTLQSSNQLFVSNTITDKNIATLFVSSGDKVYTDSDLSTFKLNVHIHSIYLEERYMRISLRKDGVQDVSKIISHCIVEKIFKKKIEESAFNDPALKAQLEATFNKCIDGHELTLVPDFISPSLWVLTDSPNFFVVYFNELSYEILRAVEKLGADLKCITHIFDGIGTREHFLIKVFHAILYVIDFNFGENLLKKLNEKIIASDVIKCTQTSKTRLINGTWKYIWLMERETNAEHANIKMSEASIKLIKKLNPFLITELTSDSSSCIEKKEGSQTNAFYDKSSGLNYLMTQFKPLVTQIMSRIPVKFMTVGQFNEMGCPISFNDLVIIVKSSDCNINDTRRLLPRSVNTVELLLDEK